MKTPWNIEDMALQAILLRDAEIIEARLASVSSDKRANFHCLFNEAGWDVPRMRRAILIGVHSLPQSHGHFGNLSFDPYSDEI